MGTVNINLGEDTQLNLVLGQQLENEVTEVVFDFSAWQSAYGSGIVGLSVQRHGDDRPYAVDPTVSGTEATWNISDLDTARKGVGEVQVTYTVGTVIKKSVVYKFTVYRSLGENGEYPSPGQTWQEEIEAELTDVKADLNDLKNKGAGLTEDAKQALLACFQQVAWIGDDGQDYYDALETALYPPANLVSISAVYTQSGTVYDTDSLDDLKHDLVVTARYNNGNIETVTAYVLSGTLMVGTSNITVSYKGKTTTFVVNVTESLVPAGYTKYDYITYNLALNASTQGLGIIAPIEMKSEYTYETTIYYDGDVSSAQNIMGTRDGGGTQQFGLFVNASTGELSFWYEGGGGLGLGTSKDTITNIKVLPVGASNTYPNYATILINDTEYSTNKTAARLTWRPWLGFFKYARAADALNTANGSNPGLRIGETIIRNSSNIIIHDFIPASDGSHYGFYDNVDKAFYYDSAHSDKFIGGYWEV